MCTSQHHATTQWKHNVVVQYIMTVLNTSDHGKLSRRDGGALLRGRTDDRRFRKASHKHSTKRTQGPLLKQKPTSDDTIQTTTKEWSEANHDGGMYLYRWEGGPKGSSCGWWKLESRRNERRRRKGNPTPTTWAQRTRKEEPIEAKKEEPLEAQRTGKEEPLEAHRTGTEEPLEAQRTGKEKPLEAQWTGKPQDIEKMTWEGTPTGSRIIDPTRCARNSKPLEASIQEWNEQHVETHGPRN